VEDQIKSGLDGLQFFDIADISFLKGHTESLSVLQENIKKTPEPVCKVEKTSQLLEEELNAWKRVCEDLQDELASLKDSAGRGTFTVHGLKGSRRLMEGCCGVCQQETQSVPPSFCKISKLQFD
jgi:hypothetical protein